MMTQYLSRDTVRGFRGKIEPFEVEEMGGALALRAVGFKTAMRVQEIEDEVERAVEFIRNGIIDPETGQPMFGADEFPEIVNNWSVDLFKRIADKLKDLSGTEMREAEGNSSATPKGGSPTS